MKLSTTEIELLISRLMGEHPHESWTVQIIDSEKPCLISVGAGIILISNGLISQVSTQEMAALLTLKTVGEVFSEIQRCIPAIDEAEKITQSKKEASESLFHKELADHVSFKKAYGDYIKRNQEIEITKLVSVEAFNQKLDLQKSIYCIDALIKQGYNPNCLRKIPELLERINADRGLNDMWYFQKFITQKLIFLRIQHFYLEPQSERISIANV